jgi:type II secretory pathway component PulK
MRQQKTQRRGVVLVAALVCLLIVMTMLGSMLLATLRSARQLRAERDLRQCELLLLAGVDRAVFRLGKEMDYRGEIWALPAAAIALHGDGLVTIEVSPHPADESPQVTVIAEYPTGSEHSIRRSRTIQIQSKMPQPEE